MNFIKKQWRKFIDYIEFNKKTIIRNILMFIPIIVSLLLIDLLTKRFLFDENNLYDQTGKISWEGWLFGVRSVKNTSFTFIPLDVNVAWEMALITIFNIIILLTCLISLIFVRLTPLAIFVAFIFSGALGNTVDRLAYGYVRDIIYLPWADHGTFNFADVDVIVGCGGYTITMLVYYLFFRNKY